VLFTYYHCTIKNSLTIRGVQIPIANSFKFLGVVFDRRLTWMPHVQYLETKTASRVNLLRRLTATGWGASARTLIILYKALIKSIFMYASVAFYSAPVTTIKRLELIQRRALTIALGLSRSTRCEDTLALAGEPTLRFDFIKRLRRFGAKATFNEDLYIATIFKDSWYNHYGNQSERRQIIWDAFLSVKPQLDGLVRCDKVLATLPPWRMKYPQIDTTLTNCGDKNENANVLKTLADGIIDANSACLTVFTDASKLSDGQVGFGVVVREPSASEVTHSVRLNDNISIFKAELFAIYYALLNVTAVYPLQKIFIYTASLSSVSSIASGNTATNPTTLNNPSLLLLSKISRCV
jgi:hypothetical protein